MESTITFGRKEYAALMAAVQQLINVQGRQYMDSGVKENQTRAAIAAAVAASQALEASEVK